MLSHVLPRVPNAPRCVGCSQRLSLGGQNHLLSHVSAPGLSASSSRPAQSPFLNADLTLPQPSVAPRCPEKVQRPQESADCGVKSPCPASVSPSPTIAQPTRASSDTEGLGLRPVMLKSYPDGLLTLVRVLPEHSQPLGVVLILNVRPRAHLPFPSSQSWKLQFSRVRFLLSAAFSKAGYRIP